jgi:uncharacterized RDD family membrane protein YckC
MNEYDTAGAPAANPYAPPEARVAILGDALPRADLASRGTRLGAKLIDGVVLGVVVFAAVMLGSAAGASPNGEFGGSMMALLLLGFGLVLGLQAWLLHRHGQTIGKKLLRIRIVRGDLSRCGLGRIVLLRLLPFSIVGLIPLIGPAVSLVDVLLIFSDDHRTLHDRLADTVVVTA